MRPFFPLQTINYVYQYKINPIWSLIYRPDPHAIGHVFVGANFRQAVVFVFKNVGRGGAFVITRINAGGFCFQAQPIVRRQPDPIEPGRLGLAEKERVSRDVSPAIGPQRFVPGRPASAAPPDVAMAVCGIAECIVNLGPRRRSVIPQDAVGHRERGPIVVGQSAAGVCAGVAIESAVNCRQRRSHVIYRAAAAVGAGAVGRVPTEGTIGQRDQGIGAEHSAAQFTRRVAGEDTSGYQQ